MGGMIMKQILKFLAGDGSEFESESACLEYEGIAHERFEHEEWVYNALTNRNMSLLEAIRQLTPQHLQNLSTSNIFILLNSNHTTKFQVMNGDGNALQFVFSGIGEYGVTFAVYNVIINDIPMSLIPDELTIALISYYLNDGDSVLRALE